MRFQNLPSLVLLTVASVALLAALLGCSSTTTIKSNPPGARLYIDGRLAGTTPVEHKDAGILTTEKRIRLRLRGYEDIHSKIEKDEVNLVPVIAGLWLLIPWLWATEYPDSYTFELEPTEECRELLATGLYADCTIAAVSAGGGGRTDSSIEPSRTQADQAEAADSIPTRGAIPQEPRRPEGATPIR